MSDLPKPNNDIEFIYRLVVGADWRRAQQAGFVAYQALDQKDGFLHLSTHAQVLQTAARYYQGVDDLFALEVRYADVKDLVKFEPSSGGALFPHLYGRLPLAAIQRVVPLVRVENGDYRFNEKGAE